jgi:hypothetical protein
MTTVISFDGDPAPPPIRARTRIEYVPGGAKVLTGEPKAWIIQDDERRTKGAAVA